MGLFSNCVSDEVIVPETPGPSCTKPKGVVTVEESPSSASDTDSSFAFAITSKQDILRNDKLTGVLERKDNKSDSPEVKQDTDDDSIFEAETQCDIDSSGMSKNQGNKLHVSSVSCDEKICINGPDHEEDLFGAETQCEELPIKIPVKSFSPSDLKKQNLPPRSEIIDAVEDDIYEAETQCVLDNIPNKKIRVVVSKEKVDPKSVKSLEREGRLQMCNVDKQCKTDHLFAKDRDDPANEHDEIHDAPTQCFLRDDDDDETTVLGKTDSFSVCSEQTEEYIYNDGSQSSHEDVNIKMSLGEKVGITDSSGLIDRKAVGFENKMAKMPSSNTDDQQKVQQDRQSEKSSIALDVILNEDSFDHTLLEGDDDFFAFEATQISDSKEAAYKNSKTTEKFSEVHQKGSKSKSNNTNSSNTQTSFVCLSEQCTISLKSEKTVSASEASGKGTSKKSISIQAQNVSGERTVILETKTQSTIPLMKSVTASNKETAKVSNESDNETDPEDIFEAEAQSRVPLNKNEKVTTKSFHHSSIRSSSYTPTIISSNNSKLSAQSYDDSGDEKEPKDMFEAKTRTIVPPLDSSKTILKLSEPSSSNDNDCSETSATFNSDNMKTGTQSPTNPGNAEDQDRIFETQNQGVEPHHKNCKEFTKLQDSSKQNSSHSVTNIQMVISTEKGKTQTQVSTEFKDNSDIFDAATQVVSVPYRNGDFTDPSVFSRKETTDVPIMRSSNSVKISPHLNCASGDNDNEDSIFEAATQIMETANRSKKDFIGPFAPSPVEKTNVDNDDSDSISEAVTQIVEMPSRSKKDFTGPFAPSPVEKRNADDDDDDDSIFEAATQVVETPNRSKKDFIGSFAPSLVEKTNVDHDDSNSIFEAATQIVETTNESSKDFTKASKPSSKNDKTCIPATSDTGKVTQLHNSSGGNDEDIFQCPTQIIQEKTNTSEIKDSGNGDDADRDGYENTFKKVQNDNSVVVTSKVDSKKGSNFGQPKLSINSDNETDTVYSASTQEVNFPDSCTTEVMEREKSESRDSCVIGNDKDMFGNLRPTKCDATPGVKRSCDRWFEIKTQKIAEVIPQKDSNEIPEMAALKKVLDMTVSDQMNPCKEPELSISKEELLETCTQIEGEKSEMTYSSPRFQDSDFKNTNKSVVTQSPTKYSDKNETVPSKKPVVTQSAQKDDSTESDTVAFNMSNSVTEKDEVDNVNKSEIVTSEKLVTSPGFKETNDKFEVLESKTPLDVKVCTQHDDINNRESKIPNTSYMYAQKDSGGESEMSKLKKPVVTLNVQKDGNEKIETETLKKLSNLTEHVVLHDSKISDFIAPKLGFDEMVRTKRDGTTSVQTDGGGAPGLTNSKVPEDKLVSAQKDATRKPGTKESEKPNDATKSTERGGEGKCGMVESENLSDVALSACDIDGGKPSMEKSKESVITIADIQKNVRRKSGLTESKKLTDAQGDGVSIPELQKSKKAGDTAGGGSGDGDIKLGTGGSRKQSDIVVSAQRDSHREPEMRESKKQFDTVVSTQRYDDRKPEMSVLVKLCDVEKPEIAESVKAQKDEDGQPGMEESKKADLSAAGVEKENADSNKPYDPIASTHIDSDGTAGMKELKKLYDNAVGGQRYYSGKPEISDSEKPYNVLISQKEGGQKPEVEGSKVPCDTNTRPHEDSGDETEPENFFEANSHCTDTLKSVHKSAVPVSEETAQRVHKNEVIHIEDEHVLSPLLVSIRSTEDKKEPTLITESVSSSTPFQSIKMYTEPTCADVSTNSEPNNIQERGDTTPALTLVTGNDSSTCDDSDSKIATFHASIQILKMDLKSKESSDQSANSGKNSASIQSELLPPKTSFLPQDESAGNREQQQNFDLQEGTCLGHNEDIGKSGQISLVSTKTEWVTKSLEAETSSIQKEYDTKLHPDISQQIIPVSEEGDSVVGAVGGLVDDSLSDTLKLIMPSSQDLWKAVRESEAQESPFKPEELLPSEDEQLSPVKISHHSHLPSKRAKVRKRLNIECRTSAITLGASRRRHVPDRSPVDVSMMSDTAAGTSRKRKLPDKDPDTSKITFLGSKQRKLSDNSLQYVSKTKTSDITSHRRSRGCAGDMPQNKTAGVINTDSENKAKGGKTKIVTAKKKGHSKSVTSISSQKVTDMKQSLESSRRERSRNKVERNEKKEDLTSEQYGETRRGRRSKQMAESTKDNDNKEARKSRRERTVTKSKGEGDVLAGSIRPSRQRKMTWKVLDSLGSDSSQGSISPGEENSKNRSKGHSSNNSQNETYETLELSASRSVRPRNVSPTKSPSKKLLKNSQDSGNDTSKEAKGKINNFVSGQQNVSVCKLTRQSKEGKAITSVTEIAEKESPKRMTRQNNREVLCNNRQKRKNGETITDISSKRSKKVDQVLPLEISQRNSTDKCHLNTSRSVLAIDENLKVVSSESNTRGSGRKGKQSAVVGLMQEHSAVVTNICTVLTENGKQRPVLKTASTSSTDSGKGHTGRSVRKRMEVTSSSQLCLNEQNTSVFLSASSIPHRGVKRTKRSVEEGSEPLPAKQTESEKRLSLPYSPSVESSVQNVISLQPSRTSRTRGKVTSPQKLEATGIVKQDTKPGQRVRTCRNSKTEEVHKGLKNESVSPKSRKINLSEYQDITLQHARSSRWRGTLQSSSQLNSWKVSFTITSSC
jgi:hypothetical protein